jgi:hypothetical protein
VLPRASSRFPAGSLQYIPLVGDFNSRTYRCRLILRYFGCIRSAAPLLCLAWSPRLTRPTWTSWRLSTPPPTSTEPALRLPTALVSLRPTQSPQSTRVSRSRRTPASSPRSKRRPRLFLHHRFGTSAVVLASALPTSVVCWPRQIPLFTYRRPHLV